MDPSQDKVAVVTGAGSGIGKAVAVALVNDGWRVVFAGRRLDRLQEAIVEASGANHPQVGAGASVARALAVSTDVTHADAVRALFAKTREAFGRLDLLFNNAGISAPPMPLEDLPLEQWQNVVNTNLTGPFLCTQEAMKIMKSQTPRGGRIINNGSIAAHSPRPNSVAYTATKHAITGLTKQTSLDGRANDIACGQIDIGNARTELADRLPRTGPNVEPMMDVQYVARAVLHMANLPPEANVQFMTIMATKMPFIGRG
ncbi:MAG TPA: SDR family oxidoreductase [Steroidobacteraceae bacterium]|nr:SDR family oxidoreductase [Steroidobacteraceae bacterium]